MILDITTKSGDWSKQALQKYSPCW